MNIKKLAGKIIVLASNIKVGDEVQFHDGRRVYKVVNINQWGRLDLKATTGGPRGSAPTGVSPSDVHKVGDKSEIVDKKGRSAYLCAKDEFNGKYVVTDWPNTTREMLAEIKSIQSDGTIVVQEFSGARSWNGQEEFVPDTTKRGDIIKFKPKMYDGEWTWWGGGKTLDQYKGGSLTWLLD